ncbi:hypothetical protein FRC03_010708 [Tulasnella sp. 419]|nr:hypothetical protein FRC03_010708 [Tulasnella sp. 419]
MQLQEFFSKKEDLDNTSANGYSPLGLRQYWCDKNAESIDGLPGLKIASKTAGLAENKRDIKGRTFIGKILSERDGRLVLLAAFTGGFLLSNLWSAVASRSSFSGGVISSLLNYP